MRTGAYPAPPVEEVQELGGSHRSTCIYNFLDYPAGVVPVTTASAADVAEEDDPKTNRREAKENRRNQILLKIK